jgi:hypothetical protein
VFENDPTIGGRYSALSYFGMVPAALLGIDTLELLGHAREMARACEDPDPVSNPAARLGALLGTAANVGRDKLVLLLSEPIASLGDWIEQLIAESTGKDGVGILPLLGARAEDAASDRVYVCLCAEDDRSLAPTADALAQGGHPVARIDIPEPLSIGGQFFLWEMATAIAGAVLGINPFDQPNVEAAKTAAREMVETYLETGTLPALPFERPEPETVGRFLEGLAPGDYVGLQAYLPPRDELGDGLVALRSAIGERYHVATTCGFGPRFLHSTGQLHKGDRGTGRFIQFVTGFEKDVPIPSDAGEESMLTFGTLIAAQAGGDRSALEGAGRRVLTVRLDRAKAVDELRTLAQGLGTSSG